MEQVYIEVYRISTTIDIKGNLTSCTISMEGICDIYSSLLWDIRYYECGRFEVYTPATPEMIRIFKEGSIVKRSDDDEHYGVVESVALKCSVENGDYIAVSGRFLTSYLSRRIILPLVWTNQELGFLVEYVTYFTCMEGSDREHDSSEPYPDWFGQERRIPGLCMNLDYSGCWNERVTTITDHVNLMDWMYDICQAIGGTANVSLNVNSDGTFSMPLNLSEGVDRSVLQSDRPHVIFSDEYNNILGLEYSSDTSQTANFAYVLGVRNDRHKINIGSPQHQHFDRYEYVVDASETTHADELSPEQYDQMLNEKASEKSVVLPQKEYEFTIAANTTQFEYQKDYSVGDYVAIEYTKLGITIRKAQLVGMIESIDRNGRQLTPTVQIVEV